MPATTVLIVGGGPAGAACAWQLQRHDIPCLILDRSTFPRVKPCAGWVTPQVFRYLELSPQDYPHSLTQFTSFDVSLHGLQFRLPTHQYAIRRIEFDAWLLARSGAKVQHHQVRQIEKQGGNFIVDDQFSAPYLVGAGGTHCPVRRMVFNTDLQNHQEGLIITKEEEFPYTVNDDRCHLWFFEDGLPGYAWYVPKTGGYVNVGIGGSAARLKAEGHTLQDHWNHLLEKLDRAGLVSGHTFAPLGYSYHLRRNPRIVRRDGAFLVGDALGLATKDMGEGIGAAIHSGILAAQAIIHNQPYEIRSIPRYSLPSILGLRK